MKHATKPVTATITKPTVRAKRASSVIVLTLRLGQEAKCFNRCVLVASGPAGPQSPDVTHLRGEHRSKGCSGVPTTNEDEIRALLLGRQFAEAFDLAMATCGDWILGLAISILGDRSAAEDAVQNVMIRIWRALPQFRGDASISTWIYSITRNRCLTVLKHRRGEPISLDDPESRESAANLAAVQPHIGRISRLPEWLDFVAAGAVLAFAGGLAWQAGLFAAVVSALSLSP